MEINLTLEVAEVNAILQLLGDLPSKTGAYQLIVKIKEQADPQVTPAAESPEVPA